MPILTLKNEVALTITYKCNWNCCYCAVNNKHDYKDVVTHEDVLNKIQKIRDGSIVTIFGGEPGLVDKCCIVEYVDLIRRKCKELWIETNGTFIRRYPELICLFDGIIYHCSKDLDYDDEIVRCEHKNMHYMIIVHDDNITRLEKFLSKNDDIKFDIVEATYPYPEMKGPTLSTSNKNHIITHYSRNMTKESIKRMIFGKDFESIQFLT